MRWRRAVGRPRETVGIEKSSISRGTPEPALALRGVNGDQTPTARPNRSLGAGTVADQPPGEFGELDEFLVIAQSRLRPALVAACGPAAAEDALQDAVAYACEHWERLRRMRNPYGYLYRVGQSAGRRRGREVPVGFPEVAAIAPTGPVDHRLPGALAELSQKQRVAVVLHVGLGWTLDEVAEVMELSRSSVRNHVERGMEKLKRSLADEDDA